MFGEGPSQIICFIMLCCAISCIVTEYCLCLLSPPHLEHPHHCPRTRLLAPPARATLHISPLPNLWVMRTCTMLMHTHKNCATCVLNASVWIIKHAKLRVRAEVKYLKCWNSYIKPRMAWTCLSVCQTLRKHGWDNAQIWLAKQVPL